MKADEKSNGSLFENWNNIANWVTISRIVLVIAFIAVLLRGGSLGQESLVYRWIAAGLFIIAAATDKVDGVLARRYDLVTNLGKLLDPIADKLLILSTLVVLSFFGEIPWWITALFCIREIGVTILRFVVVDRRGIVIPANNLGKIKTVFEIVALAMFIIPLWSVINMNSPMSTILTVYFLVALLVLDIALITCLYSGFVYVQKVRQLTREAQ